MRMAVCSCNKHAASELSAVHIVLMLLLPVNFVFGPKDWPFQELPWCHAPCRCQTSHGLFNRRIYISDILQLLILYPSAFASITHPVPVCGFCMPGVHAWCMHALSWWHAWFVFTHLRASKDKTTFTTE